VVAPGRQGDFMLVFSPQSQGVHNGTITVISNDPDEARVVLEITGIGTAGTPSPPPPPGPAPDIRFVTSVLQFPPGCAAGTVCRSPLSVFNDGNAVLRITSIRGTPPFGLDNIPGDLVVPPGQQGDFMLVFFPQREGTHNGTMTVVSNDPDEGTVVLDITGTAVAGAPAPPPPPAPTPDIRFAATLLRFGECMAGTVCRSPISVFNDGSAVLRISSIRGTGPFGLDNIPGDLVVMPGQQGDFMLVFSPASEGTHNGTITVVSNDPDEGTVVLDITGTGTPPPRPDIHFVSTNLQFRACPATATCQEAVTIFNQGQGSLSVTSIQTSGRFSVVGVGGTLVIPPGQSRDVTLAFRPTDLGTHNGTITVMSNDPDEPSVVLNATGQGTQGAQVSFLNDLVICNPGCASFTARLTASEGYTWVSVSGVESPFQLVTTPRLSNFVGEAVEFGQSVTFFGSFTITAGRRYTIVATLSGGNLVLALVDRGVVASLSAADEAMMDVIEGDLHGAGIRFAPAP